MIFIPKPGSTADGDDNSNEEIVEVDAIPNCKQYIESSGSEIILTLPMDPHLPNIVYIKSIAAKAIPADASVSDKKENTNSTLFCFGYYLLDQLGIWSHW